MTFPPRTLQGAAVTGLGAHRPECRVDNVAIAARIGSSEEWIQERSGIITRGISDRSVVDMGTDAAAKAIAAAGVDPLDVDLVLLATCSMPGPLPGGAPEIAARLGATTAGASDIGAGCAGFSYALGLAADSVRAGTSRHVVVIGSELLSPMVDPDDRGTSFLFGDGAGAAVVSQSRTDRIGPVVWQHDGEQHARLSIEGSPLRVAMEGRAIYRWATAALPALAKRACAAAGIGVNELKAFIPHQANLRITESVVASLQLSDAVVVARDVVDSGNTSAASVPLAWVQLQDAGVIQPGDPVLLLGFGAGLTAAGQVVLAP